ncbi:hypothetical protein ASG79_15390 [Arthrobacter sp. Soil761]|nr:hypothetical protein [Arthrobacter sp. B2I5]KRE64380.1 hypothetical protein ASG79_15390 [Arthrobacter sp. Soil761]MDQ0826088.1 hypothetical protein [Arthrobacter sp. B2I5]
MVSDAGWQPVDDWTVLAGLEVEVWDKDRLVDQGTVDTVTADGAIFWLKHYGILQRRAIEKVDHRYVKVIPVPQIMEGTLRDDHPVTAATGN